MSTQITPGCLALIIQGPYSGNTHTVGQCIGQAPKFDPGQYWELDGKFETSINIIVNHHPENWLMRIDDHQEDEQDATLYETTEKTS